MTRHGRILSPQRNRGSMLGVAMNGSTNSLGDLGDVASMGFKWVRSDCRWDMFESTKGNYNFTSSNSVLQLGTTLDSALSMCTALGLKLLITFYETPSWARSSPRPNGGGSTSKRPPDNMVDYYNALVALLSRYAPGGARSDLRSGLGAIEVWNEPNWYIFWKSAKVGYDNLGPDGKWGSPNVTEYRDMLNYALLAGAVADPTVPIVAGGVAGNVDNTNYSYMGHDFIRHVLVPTSTSGIWPGYGPNTPPPGDYNLTNTVNYAILAGLGFHPYVYPCPPLIGGTSGPRGGLMYAQQALEIIKTEAGIRNLPLWNTECGYPTRDQGANNAGECTRGTNLTGYSLKLEDLNDCAVNLAQMYDTWYGLGSIPGTTQQQFAARYGRGAVGPSFWYCYRNPGANYGDPEANFGIYYHASQGGAAKTPIRNALMAQTAKLLFS